MAVSQEKISVHSLADLKNTSDDAIPTYLTSLKFTQSHTLSNVRLAIGYSAFAICAATFYWDYKFGFDATKFYTTIAVALYTILNGALTFWIFYIEAGTVYVGTAPSGETIRIRTKTKKHVPIYDMSVRITGGGSGERTVVLKKPFTQWFDKEGRMHALPFQQMLASSVGVIGKVDPKRVVKEETKKEGKGVEGKSMEEKWASLLAESSSGVESGTPSKAKKRGKKA